MMPRRLLIVSHEADRTGAPISALTLAKEFVQRGYELQIILRRNGVLFPEFEKLGKTHVFRSDPSFDFSDVPSMFGHCNPVLTLKCLRNPDRPYCLSRIERESVKELTKSISDWAPDAIYVNTTHCGDVLDALGELGAPVLMHVRELGATLKALDKERKEAIVRHTTHAVCVSARVARELVIEFPLLDGKTSIEAPAVDMSALSKVDGSNPIFLTDVTDGSVLVLGVGVVGARKGADLFVKAAKATLRTWSGEKALRFVWLGDGVDRGRYLAQLAEEGYGKQILFPGEVDNPFDFYRAASVLLCTSREDPYPRVMIEAGACGVPVIAFENAGGADDFIENYDAGELVSLGDIEAMASTLTCLLWEKSSKEDAIALSNRVRIAHDPAASAERIIQRIDKLIC